LNLTIFSSGILLIFTASFINCIKQSARSIFALSRCKIAFLIGSNTDVRNATS
jgi:hypothetical protein